MSKLKELLLEKRRAKLWLVSVDDVARAVDQDEAESAKALPVMPDYIREIVETLRRPAHITCRQQEALVAFLDATFPKPVPQWELDARDLESLPSDIARGIAARIRDANRGK